ncbi:MAG: hypothetical protein ACTSVC_08765, partial [Promethearchaeota archaeon]
MNGFESIFERIFQNSHWSEDIKKLLQDPLWGYARGFNLLLWIGVIITLITTALVLFKRSRKEGILVSQKRIYAGFGVLLSFFSITITFYMLAYNIEPYFDLLKELGYTFSILGPVPIILAIENYMFKKTKHFFSIFSIALAIFCIIFLFISTNSSVLRTITGSGAIVLILLFFILYMKIIALSVGRIRSKSIITFLGLLCIAVAILLDSEAVMEAGIPLFIAPSIYI